MEEGERRRKRWRRRERGPEEAWDEDEDTGPDRNRSDQYGPRHVHVQRQDSLLEYTP